MPIGIKYTIPESEITDEIEVETIAYNFVFIKQGGNQIEIRQKDIPEFLLAIEMVMPKNNPNH